MSMILSLKGSGAIWNQRKVSRDNNSENIETNSSFHVK